MWRANWPVTSVWSARSGSTTSSQGDQGPTAVGQTSEQLRSKSAQTPPNTGHHQGPEDEAGHYQLQPCDICKTSIPGSNPGGASNSKFPSPKHLAICGGPDDGPVRAQTDVSFH